MRTLVFLIAGFCLPALAAALAVDDAGMIAPAPRPTSVVKEVTLHGSDVKVKLATRAGAALDQAKLNKDVKTLWATGLFEDIKVNTTQEPDGVIVEFAVAAKPATYLRDLRIEPHSYGLQPAIPSGAPLD